MADASLRVTAPILAVVDGIPTTTSVDVARHFGKQHRNVVQAIESLIAQLPADALLNFQQGSYTLPETGDQQHKLYRLTRDGFTLLAMGFTGKRALQFKLAYIDAFNRMEAELRNATRQPAMVITQKPTEAQVASAMGLGHAIAGHVQQSVAMAVLRGGDDWKHQRWLLSFVTDSKHGTPPVVKLVPADAYIMSTAELCRAMQNGDVSKPELLELATSATAALHATTCAAPKGWGNEVARKITPDLPLADLHAIATAATTELMLRVPVPAETLAHTRRKVRPAKPSMQKATRTARTALLATDAQTAQISQEDA